jgi:hypothetical protein
MTTAADCAMRECSACHQGVPTGPFCGRCGADQRTPATQIRKLLRPNAFIAAHRQPVFIPMITSTLCPHLAGPDRIVFRHGLILAAGGLIGVSALQHLPLLVVLTAFAIPLLFVLYLWRSDIFRDIPARAMILTPIIGVALGVTWWVWSADRVSHSYGIPLSAGFQLQSVLNLGLAVSAVDTLLKWVPAVVVRLLRIPSIESLDGYVIGALGALAYTTAGTVTWLAPQFVAGLLDYHDSWRLLSQAILYGVFDPLTAAAAGGTMGLLLWFRPGKRTGQPRRLRMTLAICVAVTSCCYLGLYVVDAGNNLRGLETAINLAITIAAVQTLRFALQIAVMHEAPGDATGEPVRCIHCSATVPDMPFCPECGCAARASSRSARRLRLGSAP